MRLVLSQLQSGKFQTRDNGEWVVTMSPPLTSIVIGMTLGLKEQ